jgi:hypothetical protein
MPLEKLSLNFMENLICRLEKERIKDERKKQWTTVLLWAISVISLFCIPALAIYLCMIFISGFSFSFTLTKVYIHSLILLAGFSVLLLLLSDIWLEKYIRSKKKTGEAD